MKTIIILKGGPDSGNFDHAGRPGHVGGSDTNGQPKSKRSSYKGVKRVRLSLATTADEQRRIYSGQLKHLLRLREDIKRMTKADWERLTPKRRGSMDHDLIQTELRVAQAAKKLGIKPPKGVHSKIQNVGYINSLLSFEH